MDKELQINSVLRQLNLILSNHTEWDDDRFALIANAIMTFNNLPAVQAYRSHRAEIEEMVRRQPKLDEFLKGNYSARKKTKTFKEIRNDTSDK